MKHLQLQEAWTLTDLNTQQLFQLCLKMQLEMKQSAYSDSIIHDDIAPTVPTISIAGGADFATSTSGNFISFSN